MKSILRRKGMILRVEGIVLFILTLAAYMQLFSNLWAVAAALLIPDLLLPKRVQAHKVGNWIFNLIHTYPAPALLITYAVIRDYTFQTTLAAVPLLWFMHIGFDRMLGRGARYDGAVVDDLYARAAILMASPEMADHNLRRLGGWADEDEK